MRVSPTTAIYIGAAALGLALAYYTVKKIQGAGAAIGGAVSSAATAAVDAASSAAAAVNPVNPDNVFAKATNAVVSSATGTDQTFGGWLWELVHPGAVAAENVAIGAAPASISPPPAAPATPANGSLIPGIPPSVPASVAAPDLSEVTSLLASP